MLPTTLAAGSYLPARIRRELDWTKPIGRGAKQMSARRVQEHLTLNGFAVDIDADFGPATEKRVGDFQRAKGLPQSGIVDFATYEQLLDPMVRALKPITPAGKTLSRLTLEYALQHVSQHPREAGGDNRGPWVRGYLGWDGADARWCAGFTCFALEQAAHSLGISLPIATSASCDALAIAAKKAKLFVAGPTGTSSSATIAKLKPGSFFLVRKTASDYVHVGIVSDAGEKSFDTVEGNTDSGGSANGFEAAERSRGYAAKDFIVW